MSNIELSIIIPIYNVDKYIKDCINSILCQTCKRKYEIILVDDGSNDNSGKICDYYSEKYEFIKTIHKKNEGVSKARNTGLDVANGKYIMFIDGDDELEENILNDMLSAISENEVDIIECDYNEIFDNRKISKGENNRKKIKYNDIHDIMLGFFNKKISIGIWNKIFTRKVIGEVRFNENVSHYEDKLFIFNVIQSSKSLMHININGYNYRKREGSASSNQFQYSYLEIEDVDDIIVNEMKKYSEDVYIYAQKNRLETYLILIKMITIAKRYNDYKKEYSELIHKVRKSNRKVIKLLNMKRKIEVFLIKYMKSFYIIIYRTYNNILKKQLRSKNEESRNINNK